MIGRWLLAGRCLIAAVVGVALSMWLSAQSRPSALQRGGVDEFGPYDVVPNWYKPVQTGWIDYAVEVFVEGPDRVFVGSTGTSPDVTPPAPLRLFNANIPGAKYDHFLAV